jgi:hydrogen cyanide synthase HcnC
MIELIRVQSFNIGFDYYRMLDRTEPSDLLPGLGPAVSGVSRTPYDGHASPLSLLYALQRTFAENGGHYFPNGTATAADAAPNDFHIWLPSGAIGTPKVVLAAGLGNADLDHMSV